MLTTDEARRRILAALDVPDLPAALALAHTLRGRVGGFKVGLELCLAEGVPAVVEAVSAVGGRLFLDLKLKDIPNTVAGAVGALVRRHGAAIGMLTLHCDGGGAMLRAAAAAARAAGAPPLLLGVTVLTSIDAGVLSGELGVASTLEDQVLRLARLARDSGLGGVVASPHEAAAIKAACGPALTVVTPGVRPAWAAAGDQQRVMTPAEALAAGADYLVIGRPITAPPAAIGGPAAAAERIVAEIAGHFH